MRTIAAILVGACILACGGSEEQAPSATKASPAPSRPETARQPPPTAQSLADRVVWGGEGPAPDLQADIRACEEEVARDPRAATADPGARFLGQLACLGKKGWKARDTASTR